MCELDSRIVLVKGELLHFCLRHLARGFLTFRLIYLGAAATRGTSCCAKSSSREQLFLILYP